VERRRQATSERDRNGAVGRRGARAIVCRGGWTLVEVGVALTVLVIVSLIAISTLSQTRTPDLQCAAQVVASDLAYVRQLAIVNGTTYEVRFDAMAGTYEVAHTGPDAAFDSVAPPPCLPSSARTPTGYVYRFDDLPLLSGIRLESVVATAPTLQAISSFAFESTGAVSPLQPIRITLATGQGAATRSIDIEIVPQTGLVRVGRPQGTGTL